MKIVSHRLTNNIKKQLNKYFKKKNINNKDLTNSIIDTFYSTDKHIYLKDFYEKLEFSKIKFDKKEVKKVLNILCEFGLGDERQFDNEDEIHYEHTHEGEHHDHFICIKCKNVFEFTEDELEQMQKSIFEKRGFKSLYHKLEIYGICKDCSGEKIIDNSFALSYGEKNQTYKIHQIFGCPNLKKKLTVLGFTKGEDIKLIKNSGFGPIVVELKNTRLAIGRREAERIFVNN